MTNDTPTRLARFEELPEHLKLAENGALEKMGALTLKLSMDLAPVRDTLDQLNALAQQLQERDSLYANLLRDAHEQVCPDYHYRRLTAWLTLVDDSWVLAARELASYYEQFTN